MQVVPEMAPCLNSCQSNAFGAQPWPNTSIGCQRYNRLIQTATSVLWFGQVTIHYYFSRCLWHKNPFQDSSGATTEAPWKSDNSRIDRPTIKHFEKTIFKKSSSDKEQAMMWLKSVTGGLTRSSGKSAVATSHSQKLWVDFLVCFF